jgi:outer membrane protein assembly factor BamB
VTPATDGRLVLISIFGNAYEWPYGVALYGLDGDTGSELWSLPNLGGLTAPVITGSGSFVVGSMGSPFVCGYQLHREAAATPTLQWRFRTSGVMYESLPAISGGLAYFLSTDGWLRALR